MHAALIGGGGGGTVTLVTSPPVHTGEQPPQPRHVHLMLQPGLCFGHHGLHMPGGGGGAAAALDIDTSVSSRPSGMSEARG